MRVLALRVVGCGRLAAREVDRELRLTSSAPRCAFLPQDVPDRFHLSFQTGIELRQTLGFSLHQIFCVYLRRLRFYLSARGPARFATLRFFVRGTNRADGNAR